VAGVVGKGGRGSVEWLMVGLESGGNEDYFL
jgi:hypothetical protein